ncbi:MAG TPA: hypothetical protein VK173_07815 [Lacibacter sp.]|nr:hypothetical protein [Lacibacter sp.]
MSNAIYDIDHNKLVVWLLPNRLRQLRLINWFQSLIKPVVSNYLSFKLFREAKIYQLTITPQVCYLERLMNDRYDYIQRRIVIEDSIDKNISYVYLAAELKPVYLGSKFIYTYGETGVLSNDFIIKVPLALQFTFEEPEMLSLIRSYKLAGMVAKIQYV